MAEYRALAQNTYKFITETTINHSGGFDIGEACTLPRIKCISEDLSSVSYYCLVPSTIKSQTEETAMNYFFKLGSSSDKNNIAYVANGAAVGDGYLQSVEAVPVVLDGAKYYGYKSAKYTAPGLYKSNYSSLSGQETKIIAAGSLPAAKMKIVMYTSATQTFSTHEINIPRVVLDKCSNQSSSYSWLYAIPLFGIQKGEEDIVIALEIEYPKYDVTVNGTVDGLQCSLDDGLTFQDVTDNMTLNQIEHVVLKNTSGVAKTIGTTYGGNEVATIANGAIYVAVPEADGTWYIS